MTSDETLCADIAWMCGWTVTVGLQDWNPTGPFVIWADPQGLAHDRPPRYDVDPGAALELLAYVSEHESVWQVMTEYDRSQHHVRIDGFGRAFKVVQSGDTLPTAIARACRDALAALREQEMQTP